MMRKLTMEIKSMRNLLSALAIAAGLGCGYYFDVIAAGASAVVTQMTNEAIAAYEFVTTDAREQGRECVRRNMTTNEPISDYCRTMVKRWRASDGDGAVLAEMLAIGAEAVALDRVR